MSRTTYNSTAEDVKCPHCDESNQLGDTWSDLRGPESAEVECSECGKPFTAVFRVSISVRAVAINK